MQKMIAMNENYMTTNRLEAFYDAIIAIIVTVLVLELPQPATASIESILALKTAYFAYLISFLVCTNLWQYRKNHLAKYPFAIDYFITSLFNHICCK